MGPWTQACSSSSSSSSSCSPCSRSSPAASAAAANCKMFALYDRTVEQAGGRGRGRLAGTGRASRRAQHRHARSGGPDPLHRGLAQHPGPVRRRAGPGHPRGRPADHPCVMRDRATWPTTSSSGPPTSRSTTPRWSTTTGPPAHAANDRSEASTEDLRQALVHDGPVRGARGPPHRPVTDRGGTMTERHGPGDGEEGGRRPSGRGAVTERLARQEPVNEIDLTDETTERGSSAPSSRPTPPALAPPASSTWTSGPRGGAAFPTGYEPGCRGRRDPRGAGRGPRRGIARPG